VKPRATSALLAVPVVFNLWFLRAESGVVENVNGGSVHAALIRWVSNRLSTGRTPLDGWFPLLTTGSPLIHNVEGLPHIVAGLFGVLIGGNTAYDWSNYLLMAVWPVSFYAGARLLGWRQSSALAAAFVSPLMAATAGYGYELGSYTFAGLGLWTQLWGMVLLPPTLGLAWRAINDRQNLLAPTVALALTISCHFITGYFAILVIGVWVLVSRSSGWMHRIRRAVVIVGVALIASAWTLIPHWRDGRWAIDDGFTTQGFWRDSFGLPRELRWLFTGKLFDAGATGARIPVLTVLVLVGIVVCVARFRTDARARALLALGALSLVLFAGPATFGFVLNHLPASHELLFHRYILAVQFTGILLAGAGGGWLWGIVRIAFRRTRLKPIPVAVIVGTIAALFLAPAWVERTRYASRDGALIGEQRVLEKAGAQNRTDAIAVVNQLRDGRVYSGLPTNWGRSNVVGFVPGYISFLNHDTDAVGFTLRPVRNMLVGVEPYLNEAATAQLDVLGIRYLLLPTSRAPAVRATRIFSGGDEALWSIPTSGYIAVVDTVEPIVVGRSTAAPIVRWLASTDPSRRLYATIAFEGALAALPTTTRLAPPRGSPGTVTPVMYDPSRGLFRANVTGAREAAIVLKSAYSSRWRVTVDGRVADQYMVAPGYPATTVARGPHTVEFQYITSSGYIWYFLLAVGALVVLYVFDRRRTRAVGAQSGRERSLEAEGALSRES